MSKAVSISEGGKGRIFPQTDKLKINNVGGGNSLWLPEDEVVTGTLYADENGIYLAENDGFSCYDTVVVRVEDETDPDDPDWELDPDDLDEDVWDEESYEEYQEDPEAFEEKFNDKEKWKAEKAKKEKSQKIKKVKSLKPSKITGIDPVDGNPYQVGVDSEGNLTKEMLPSSIHIVVPPWKREYKEGEEINFYGMHVYLLDKDGHPFKSEKYPTGEIPFEELLLPVTVAEGGSGDPSEHIGSTITFYREGYSIAFSDTYDDINGKFYCYSPTGTIKYAEFICYSRYGIPTPTSVTYQERSISTDNNRGTVNGWGTINIGMGQNPNISWVTTSEYFRDNAGVIKNVLGIDLEKIDHNVGEIPVQWMRSDGEMLEDYFSVTTTKDNNESENSENSEHSGTSDSGSGHSSGGF